MKTYFKIFIYVVLFMGLTSLEAKTIRYVKVNGTGDGSSWVNASGSIQTMIDNSISGDEVWVAKGTYYPTTETIARDARSKSFVTKTGVSLFGGFVGNETNIMERKLSDLDNNMIIEPWEFTNKTILSGDIDGVIDVWTKTINADGKTWKWTITGNNSNCYNVITANSNIDGFSVIGGNNTFHGGGIIVSSKSVITNCIISNCSSTSGGGIYSSQGFITNCSIINCNAVMGGGIYSSLAFVTNCKVNSCTAVNQDGGGIYCDNSSVSNSTVINCSAGRNGGGICRASADTSSVVNCNVSDCNAIGVGGGIISHFVTSCTVNNCTANTGGGISSYKAANCLVSNCFAKDIGGGILAGDYPATNCTVINCTANNLGGGVYSSSSGALNCIICNCTANKGGGIYIDSYYTYIYNCAFSNNNTAGTIGSGIYGGIQSKCITPDVLIAYKKPSSFIGVATTTSQNDELLAADWHLKEASPCINAGTSTNVSSTLLSGTDLENNPRVAFGIIDIGAYEFTHTKVQMPVSENFNSLSDWNSSTLFYNSAQLSASQSIKWDISNQKAVFSWQTNLTSTYSKAIFTYQIDASQSSKVFLRYDMYFQPYSGSVSPLGTEKLNIEYSTDFITWSTITIFSNANGTIANQTYKHDLSSKLSGKKFYIRFNANGANSNRIEKWEIDNVVIDDNGISAVNLIQESKYKYFVNNGKVLISNLEYGALVQLYDVNGKILNSKKIESEKTQFSLPKQGLYILKVSNNNSVENNKIIW